MGKVFSCDVSTPEAAYDSFLSILSLDDVAVVMDVLEAINKFNSSVLERIEGQMISSKGLGSYALCIGGQSPAYQQAGKICNNINDFVSEINALLGKIRSTTDEQREKEIDELKKAIETRIDTCNGFIDRLENEIHDVDYKLLNPGLLDYSDIIRLRQQRETYVQEQDKFKEDVHHYKLVLSNLKY